MAIQAPEVLPEPIRPPRLQPSASVETFGGGTGLEQVGQQLQRISQEGGDIAAFEKIRADQTAVEEAVGTKLSPALTQMLYDPKSGALARINQSTSIDEAHKIHDETLAQYDKTAKDIAGNLSGENQIGAFNKHAFVYGDNLNRTLMAHLDEHVKRQDEKSFNSFVDNTISQGALSYGNAANRETLLGMLDDHATQYARRNGMDAGQFEDMKSKINSNFHKTTIDQMLTDGKEKMAKDYFSSYRDQITDPRIRMDIQKNIETIPKQQEEANKKQEEEKYKTNERQSLLDLLDGKITLSEAQRRFRNDDINKSTFDHLESKLSKTDAFEKSEISDPSTFNSIRQAQLSQSGTSNEILREIADGQSDKKLRPEDVQYLKNQTKETPPSPRDEMIDAQAKNLRDFGNRYFAETNFLGQPKNTQESNKETEGLVSSFYKAVDNSKANGDKIGEIRDQIKKTAMEKRFPGLGNYKDAPDIVVNVKGEVIRVLNPDQKSTLNPKYKITPTESQRVEDQ